MLWLNLLNVFNITFESSDLSSSFENIWFFTGLQLWNHTRKCSNYKS